MNPATPKWNACCVAAALLVVATAGWTQTVPSAPTGPVTDVAPPPAEDRGSAGAVVLEKSMVPALRNKAAQGATPRTGTPKVGRNADRVMGNSRTQDELVERRRARAEALRGNGAGSQTVD